MMAVLALAVLYECLNSYQRYLNLSDSKIRTSQATSKYKRFGCPKTYILNRSFAWWRYFTTKTRMLCQNAFLFKFVFFSLGNKETIGKLSLTLEATKSIYRRRGFQQNFWSTFNHLLSLQDKRLCFENTIFRSTIHIRLSLNAGRWNIRRDAFCVHCCWSRYRVFFVGSALHMVWRHQVWSFRKWIPEKRKQRLQANNPVDSQRITASREIKISGFITRYKWER